MLTALLLLNLQTTPERGVEGWLVITKTETKPAPGLIETTPFGGLKPNLYIRVAGAFGTRAQAEKSCAALKAKGEACYVKNAGKKAGGAQRSQLKGRVAFSTKLELRGRKVELVVTGNIPKNKKESQEERCLEQVPLQAEAYLLWGDKPRKLGRFKGSMQTCCELIKKRAAPPGLHAFTMKCASISCGGGCTKNTFTILVPEDNLQSARAIDVDCTESLTAPPDPKATCDKLNLTKKTIRLTNTLKVDVSPCKGDPDSWEKVIAHQEVLRYTKRSLRRSTQKVPLYKGLWGCSE